MERFAMASVVDALPAGFSQALSGVEVTDLDTLRTGTIRVNGAGLTVLDFTGKDAQRFLQSKLSCDTRRWKRDGGSYGFAVDINGRVLFDGHFAYLPSGVIRMWAEPAMTAAIVEHLDRYIIVDDVVMTPVVSDGVQYLVGDSTPALLSSLGLTPTEEPFAVQTIGDVFVAPLERAVRPTLVLHGSPEAVNALIQTHLGEDVPLLSWGSLRALEISEGFVRAGLDLQYGVNIPLEADLSEGIHFNKGCYLGQEVIERLRSRGNANKGFRRIQWTGEGAAAGTPIVDASGAEVGVLTSVLAGASGDAVGIAVLRRRALQEELALHVGTPQGPAVQSQSPVR